MMRSIEEHFERHRTQMKFCFLNKGYPKWLIDTEMEKVKFQRKWQKRDTKVKVIP